MIEEYLDGTLGEVKKKAVEERAERDPEFQKLIWLHREVNASIRNRELYLFRELVRKVSTRYLDTTQALGEGRHRKSGAASGRLFLRIAATVLIILATGVIIRIAIFNKVSAADLYRKYYTVYRSDILQRSSKPGMESLSQAILDYEQGNYAKASGELENIIRHDPGNQLVVFYRGLACLGSGDHENAIRSFRSIPDDWNNPFNEHRRWYLSLALLAAEDSAGAARLLEQIRESKGYYASKANRILKKLKY